MSELEVIDHAKIARLVEEFARNVEAELDCENSSYGYFPDPHTFERLPPRPKPDRKHQRELEAQLTPAEWKEFGRLCQTKAKQARNSGAFATSRLWREWSRGMDIFKGGFLR